MIEAVDLALLGEGPAPYCLRRQMLAAGINQVGGLGAALFYPPRPLTYREFELAWVLQQRILAAQSRDDDERRRDAASYRALQLERAGVFESPNAAGLAPDGLPYDCP